MGVPTDSEPIGIQSLNDLKFALLGVYSAQNGYIEIDQDNLQESKTFSVKLMQQDVI